MKISTMCSFRRMQFWKLRKRIASAGSGFTLLSGKRRAPLDCCHGSYVLRQLVWKFKSQWKQALNQQRSSAQYSYDLHSYSLNFDDGSPHGFRWLFFFPFKLVIDYLPTTSNKLFQVFFLKLFQRPFEAYTVHNVWLKILE